MFLLRVALAQHATDGLFTFFIFFLTLELHEHRENSYFALICLKHHINYEILGCKQKLTLDERRGNGTWGGTEHKYLRELKSMGLGLGKGEGGGIESLFAPQHCCPVE